MNTPICDFAARYNEQRASRFHMPGHKGIARLGCEGLDITEIAGADSLYEADGIIRESEKNAGELFGARTFYSAEGSSLAVRAMLDLARRYAAERGRPPLIWAGRNAHISFVSAAALLDLRVRWLYPADGGTYMSCIIDAGQLDRMLAEADEAPAAVYITSPDYLGSMNDIRALAEVCHRHGALLLVDNAHGAYLKFLPRSLHPMDLGADICCDSAHKTLPVLTGGAYLHIAKSAADVSDKAVRESLRLFGSTSPSYLILQSLDLANRYLAERFPQELAAFVPQAEEAKRRLAAHGCTLVGQEPLKLTVAAKSCGYLGTEMAEALAEKKIIAEFSDPDYVVFMLAPVQGKAELDRLMEALLSLPRRESISAPMPAFSRPQRKMTIREAAMSPFETLPVDRCLGRTLARANAGCPPAVPILVSGEVIDKNAAECFHYYGVESCNVVKEQLQS
ncbi:MAG: aminotransferase class V-fold PLP-dependent enzyme [Oscillospiraceae bacterium]|nr:aminotransferase class V-fold PLP-dependent enzyme [Oscillospiraceae bacterium]